MKYLKEFNYINESINLEGLLYQIGNDHYLGLERYEYDYLAKELNMEKWSDSDMSYMTKKMKKLDIPSTININKTEKIKDEDFYIGYNFIDGIYSNSLHIKKFENSWFLLQQCANDDLFYFLCQELDGIIHFIMDNLFQFSKNGTFLLSVLNNKNELVEKYLVNGDNYFNKFNFYINETLGKLLIINNETLSK